MRVTRKPGSSIAVKQTARELAESKAKIGWFPSAVYEKGQPVAGIAQVQEFGSPSKGIPPRSFFRTTAVEKREHWKKTAADISRAAMQRHIAPDKVMEAVAMAAASDVAVTITKITGPPLAPATIAARKRRLAGGGKNVKGAKGGAGVAGIEKPLIDRGILLATLSYEIKGVETAVSSKKS